MNPMLLALAGSGLEDRVGALAAQLADSVKGASDPLAIGLFFAAGVLASLTPCVYPMIPIVVTYMGGAESQAVAAGASPEGRRWRVTARALFYIAGMAAVYTGLGMAAILLGKPFGSLTQTFWGYGLVALVLAVFGLGMMGLFEIRVPSFLLDRVGLGPRQGMAGAALMGATSAIVAAPCAAPIVFPLVTLVATQQRFVFGSLAMLAFSLGLGVLFLVLAIFSGLAASLPRPGGWMVTLKKIVGVVMLVLAAWFAYQGWMRL
ncbi:MAG: cytochrome c biogenesis protein CcdA [Acidobacteriota bacterium]|nr:cytochrome c biogenesis protein CcdA [Acidobacteriota bacterium]MDQ7087155.1 cytochrome c biogenesis protein CcdA [Acidobacteriota bacterium]